VKAEAWLAVRARCGGSSTIVPKKIRTRRAPAGLHTVYLCGPITGLSARQATGWRRHVAELLAGEAEIIDPMRDFPDVTRRSAMPATLAAKAERLLHGKRTVARDRFDIRRADLVFACFLGAKSASIGAVGEIFWADAIGKPVVIVREEDNVHNHDMLNEIAGWVFNNLGDAVEQVKRVLRTAARR
jgi:hypothetical protein